MENQSNSEDKSQFNMGLAGLFRINSLLNDCSFFSRTRSLSCWGETLFALSRELNYLYSEEEQKEDDKFQKELLSLMQEFNEKCFQRSEQTNDRTFYLKMGVQFSNYPKLVKSLNDYEKFLRNNFYKRDMLMLKKQDLKKAMTDL
jgi:hypothetical protein